MIMMILRVCSEGGRCPGTEGGIIISPHHPFNYPVKRDINYTIETLQGSIIELTFLAFDLEASRNTGQGGCYDSVRSVLEGKENGVTWCFRLIDSDNELLGTYCENSNIKPFNTTSNILTVIFSSDESITGSGFRAEWSTSMSRTVPKSLMA